MAITDSPDVQRLIAKTVEFQADIKQLEIYLDNERAKNKQLTTKLTEIEAYGCYVEDESGHKCGVVVKNEQLQAENKRLRKDIRNATYKINGIMSPFLNGDKYVDNGALTAIDKVVSKLHGQALKETEDK